MSTQSQAVLFAGIIGALVWVLYIIKNKQRWLVSVFPISYFLNVVLYYLAIHYHWLPFVDIDLWNTVIRLHSEFIYILMGIILMNKETSSWI